MKKLLVFIILVLALLGILEYLNVVPSRPIGVLSLLAEWLIILLVLIPEEIEN